jgi:hypothetical protein
LLREQEGVAVRVLRNQGLKLEDLREEVLNPLRHNRLPDDPAAKTHRINALRNAGADRRAGGVRGSGCGDHAAARSLQEGRGS